MNVVGDLSRDACGVFLDFRLPIPKYQPAVSLEFGGDAVIALYIRGNLCDPVRRIVADLEPRDSLLKIATVPVVAIAEHSDSSVPKQDIGMTHEVGTDAVAKPKCCERTTNKELAPRVLFLA